MPTAVLFSNASFDEPAQATILRSIESVKRKTLEDDTLKLYESCCSKNLEEIKKNDTLMSNKGILGSFDNYVEHNTINTIFESQSSNIDVTSDLKQSTKKRKLKIIPNKIETTKTIDAKTKTINLMNKVIKISRFLCLWLIIFFVFMAI